MTLYNKKVTDQSIITLSRDLRERILKEDVGGGIPTEFDRNDSEKEQNSVVEFVRSESKKEELNAHVNALFRRILNGTFSQTIGARG